MAVVVPDLPDIFEEAFELAGSEFRTGYDIKSARRSLNLLMLEWQNRGLNLFTIQEGTLALTGGTATYEMPVDTIDLIEHQIRTGTGTAQQDLRLTRISVSTYAQQTSKAQEGRPTQIYVDRGVDAVSVTLWPVPDADYTLLFYRLAGIDGLTSGIGTTAAVPPRFVPALVAGLAYRIASKKPEGAVRVPALQMEYEAQFDMAASEDESRASWFLRPDVGGYRL